MFGFFKKKLKDVVRSFSKKVEEESNEEPSLEKNVHEEKKPEIVEEKKVKEKPKKEKKKKPEKKHEEEETKPIEEIKPNEEEKPKKKSFFKKFLKKEKVEEKPLEKVSSKEEIKPKEEIEPIEELPLEKEKVEEEPKEEVKPVLEKKAEEEIDTVKIKEEKKELKEEIKEKKSLFKKLKEKVGSKKISEDKFETLFSDLEMVLLENNIALEVVDKIKESLRMDLVNVPLTNVKKIIEKSLKESLEEILTVPKLDVVEKVKEIKKEGRPAVFLIIGYNGAGKSITCAKLANYFKNKNFKPLLAAGDTFRAAGSVQLANYAKMVDVPVIQLQQQKGDSCALIFDAIKSAESKERDLVIADTAGRIHSNADLMEELEKIVRVNKPDLKILVLDALTGTDVVEQCREFDKAVGVDALIFTKVDAYDKGGGLISAAYILGKPIIFLGIGQKMDSLKEYDKKEILKSLGFD